MKLKISSKIWLLLFGMLITTSSKAYCQSIQWEDSSNGDIKTTSSFTGNVDLTNSAVLLPDRSFSRPLPQNLNGLNTPLSYLYGRKTGLNKLFFPRLFIHNRTAHVPQNEFVIESYYHPALVVDNINTGGSYPAEGASALDEDGNPDPRDGYQTSVIFRRESFSAWQITSDFENNKAMDFAIREWKSWNNPPNSNNTSRFIIKSVLNTDDISVGELSQYQNALYGNTGVRGFLAVKAMNSTNGRAALAFEGPDINNNIGSSGGIKRWIRQGSDPKSLEISDLRNNGKTFWSLYGDGIKSEMTVQNDDGSNRLRMILGANANETYIKQLYHTSGKPFHIKINNATLATFDAYDTTTLTIKGSALASGYWVDSDKRYKKNVNDIVDALSSVRQVKGVSYKYDSKNYAEKRFSKGKTLGFVAQDFKEIFPELVRENKDGFYSINYSGMIPVLTEAVKELSTENRELEERVTELETKLNNFISSTNYQSSTSDNQTQTIVSGSKEAFLNPNSPNPFTEKSIISYHLPETAKQASLFIYDLNGNIIKTFENLKHGHNQIEIKANSFNSGVYLYTLVADGREIGTHKMILK